MRSEERRVGKECRCSAFSHQAKKKIGNLPRNALRGPGYWRTDASIFKKFRVRTRQEREVRAESVNFFNHVNLGNPDSEIGVPGNNNTNAGRITSTAYFFFFQAEDGIRDHCVTGVQTCALPISLLRAPDRTGRVVGRERD